MKFIVTMKNPDALPDALDELGAGCRDQCEAFAKKFMGWGEYLNVEFDTEAETATVLPVKR